MKFKLSWLLLIIVLCSSLVLANPSELTIYSTESGRLDRSLSWNGQYGNLGHDGTNEQVGNFRTFIKFTGLQNNTGDNVSSCQLGFYQHIGWDTNGFAPWDIKAYQTSANWSESDRTGLNWEPVNNDTTATNGTASWSDTDSTWHTMNLNKELCQCWVDNGCPEGLVLTNDETLYANNDDQPRSDFNAQQARLFIFFNNSASPPPLVAGSEEGAITLEKTAFVNETQTTEILVNFTGWNTSTNNDNLTAWLHFNGTVKNMTRTGIFNGSRWNATIWIPLVDINSTNLSFYVEYTVQFSNGTNTTRTTTGGNGNLTVKLSYLITNQTMPSVVLETTHINISFNMSRNVNNSNLTFSADFNGTPITFNTSADLQYVNGSTFIGLVQTNNSAFTVNANITIQSGAYTKVRNITRTVRVLWAYYITSATIPPTINSEETFPINATIERLANQANITRVNATYNQTPFNMTVSAQYTSAYYLFEAPSVSNQETKSFDISMNVSYAGTSYIRSITQQNHTVFQIIIINCTETNPNATLEFRIYHELSAQDQEGDVDTTLTIYTTNASKTINFSFDLNDRHNYTLCLYPANTTIHATGLQHYFESNFSTRSYWIVNQSMNRTKSFIDLYLLPDALSTLIEVNAVDLSNDPVSGVFVKLLRQYVGEGVFRTVEIARTDTNGKANLHVELNDVFYMLVFDDMNSELFRSISSKISTAELFFTLNLEQSFLTVQQDVDSLTRSLSYDNVTGNVTFTFNDLNSVVMKGCLRIVENKPWGPVYNETCLESTSGTITKPVGTNLTGSYEFQGFAYASDGVTARLVEQISIYNSVAASTFGTIGLFWGFFFIVFIAMLGMTTNPVVATFLGVVASIGVYASGLFTFGGTAIFTGLIAVELLAIFLMKT